MGRKIGRSVCLALVLVMLTAQSAFAAGGIQGTLLRGNGGAGMNDSYVYFYSTTGGGYAGNARTDANGFWSKSLPADQYRVQLTGINSAYGTGFWNVAGATPSLSGAGIVTVSDGNTQTCNATLPLSCSLSGYITCGGQPVQTSVTAYWYDEVTHVLDPIEIRTSDANGRYEFPALFPGPYIIKFGVAPFVPRYSVDKPNVQTADAVTLPPGSSNTLSQSLQMTDGWIQGVVHRPDGSPAVNFAQYVYRVLPGGTLQWVNKYMNTRADGSWEVTLTPDTYKVLSWGGWGYAEGYWSQDGLVPLPSMATTVVVTANATETVDATAPVAAAIGGMIRRHADGNALSVIVSKAVLNPSTGLFEQTAGQWNSGDGTYGLNRLLPGTYKLSFEEVSTNRFVKQWWNDKPDAASADALTVTSGQELTSYDVTMCADVTSESIAGDSRILTAIDASKRMYPNAATHADAVIVTTGWNWPDALGASALAGTVNAPVLLNAPAPASMPASLDAEVARLKADGATDAYILGDTNAVSAAVETRLRTLFGGEAKVHRLGGVGRYATSLVIADEVRTKKGSGWDGTIFLAKGTDYPDALAASPLAAKKGWPVLLAETTVSGALSQRMTTFLHDHASKVVILGSENAVPSGVQLSAAHAVGSGNVERWYGADRFGTAVDIAEHSLDNGMSDDGLGFANGYGYADALCGGAYLAKKNNPLLLTAQTLPLRQPLSAELMALYPDVATARFLGGPPAVPQPIRDAIVDKMR